MLFIIPKSAGRFEPGDSSDKLFSPMRETCRDSFAVRLQRVRSHALESRLQAGREPGQDRDSNGSSFGHGMNEWLDSALPGGRSPVLVNVKWKGSGPTPPTHPLWRSRVQQWSIIYGFETMVSQP